MAESLRDLRYGLAVAESLRDLRYDLVVGRAGIHSPEQAYEGGLIIDITYRWGPPNDARAP